VSVRGLIPGFAWPYLRYGKLRVQRRRGVRALRAEAPAGGVLTCGPDPMMEAVGRVCRERGLPCRASMETVMGCGYAVCNGCAVPVDVDGEPDAYTYHLACREGTVFDEARLHWTLL